MSGSLGQQTQWCVVAENQRETSLRLEYFPHTPFPYILVIAWGQEKSSSGEGIENKNYLALHLRVIFYIQALLPTLSQIFEPHNNRSLQFLFQA